MDDEVRRRVRLATVKFERLSGQGVLIPGGLILTAAHVVHWTAEGGMTLGDFCIEEIQTATGKLKCRPLAVEPVHDIAVCGVLDSQEFSIDSDDFEDWCDRVEPVEISFDDYDLFEPFPYHIRTHTDGWIAATAQQNSDAPECAQLWVTPSERISHGTSGGPIVDDHGKLIGIVSTGHIEGDIVDPRLSPCPQYALPVWAIKQISNAMGETNDG